MAWIYGYNGLWGNGTQVPYTDLHTLNLDWILTLIKKFNLDIENIPKEVEEQVATALSEIEFDKIIADYFKVLGVLNVKLPPEGLVPMKGDGVTDDSAAWQAILTYAASNDACVFIPHGSYLLNNFTVPTGIGVYGECQKGTKLFQNGGQTGAFCTLAGENGLRDLTLDCVKYNKTAEVDALHATHSTVDNVAVLNAYTGAMFVDDCMVDNMHCADNNEDIVLTGMGNTVNTDGIVQDNGTQNSYTDKNTVVLARENVVLKPEGVLTYKTPNSQYKNPFITLKDMNNDNYNIRTHKVIDKVGAVNILDYGANRGADISNIVSGLISDGYLKIYIPSGEYMIGITIPQNVTIFGDGVNYTKLYPASADAIFTLTGNNITIADLYMQCLSPYEKSGINIIEESDHLLIKNVTLENFNYAFGILATCIWSEFYNMRIIGSINNGLFVSTASGFFNLNTFYSCVFNNNVNYAIYIDLSEQHDYANSFIGCNIEQNCKDRFGKTHTANSAVFNTGLTYFISCYFEYNGQNSSEVTLTNNDTISFMNCVFIGEKNIVNNLTDAFCLFISCKDYMTEGEYVTGIPDYTTFIANRFNKNISADSVIYEYNKRKIYPAVTEANLNTVLHMGAGNINSIVNPHNGQIVTFIANGGSLIINASLMANGVELTIPNGQKASLLVYNNKLYKEV